MMLAVVCKSKTTCEAYTYALITEMVQEETTLQADMKSYNLEDIYWDEVKTTFGYQENRNIKDLLIVLFQNDLKKKLTNEALIFMRDWRDSRTYGEMYQELAGQLENELNIRDTIQEYSLQQLLEVETYPCIDKIIASYLTNDVLNGSITVEELEAIIEERENKLFFPEAAHTLHALLEARRLFADIELKMNGLDINSPEEGFMAYVKNLYTTTCITAISSTKPIRLKANSFWHTSPKRYSWHTPTTIS